MRGLYLDLLVLVAVTSVAVADVEEEFMISTDTSSHLFSQCMEDRNKLTGSLYSISVNNGVEYVRFDASGSNRTITWEAEADDVADSIECAYRAQERGAFMFKFTTSSRCELALDDAYDRSQPSCGGTDIVFITTAPFCVKDDKTYGVGEMTDDVCPKTCTEKGFSEDEMTGQAEVCCASKPDCGEVVKEKVPWCEARDYCASKGLRLPSLDEDGDIDALYDFLVEACCGSDGFAGTWVGVYKDGSDVWRHLGSDNPVDAALWGRGEPTDVGRCAVATPGRHLVVLPCSGGGFGGYWCEAPTLDFPICPSSSS